MSKHKKVVKQHEVAAKMLKEARDRMEQFCINDFTLCVGSTNRRGMSPGWRRLRRCQIRS